MKQLVEMIAAPPGLSPGGYVGIAYADRDEPTSPVVELEAIHVPRGWQVSLVWDCLSPVNVIGHETNLFLDAAAILTPLTPDSPLYTMGDVNQGVEGALWRAENDRIVHIHAEGLGSVRRGDAPTGWIVESKWEANRWHVSFLFLDWPALNQFKKIAIAVWQGAEKERGGLKSISADWIEIS